MDEGRIIARGTPQGLIEEHIGAEVVELYSSDPLHSDAMAPSSRVPPITSSVPATRCTDSLRRKRRARGPPFCRSSPSTTSFIARAPTLEDVFLRLTGHALVDD